MRLSLIFELLLIFVLLAFAASAAVIESRATNTRKKSPTKKHGKVGQKNRQEVPNKYCSCSVKLCNCCREFNLPVVALQGPGCASLQYLKGDRLAISMSFGERVLTNTTISSKKPKPVCMPLPGGVSQFCGRVYNIGRQGEDFNACLALELHALQDVEAALRVSCFRFGPRGLRVEPSQPLPIVEDNETDDDDDDDDDDEEDEFDFDDDDEDNDVDATDYEGFSVFGDDFIDSLFAGGSEAEVEETKPPARKVKTTTTKAPLRQATRKPEKSSSTTRKPKPVRRKTTTVSTTSIKTSTAPTRVVTKKPSTVPSTTTSTTTVQPIAIDDIIVSNETTEATQTPDLKDAIPQHDAIAAVAAMLQESPVEMITISPPQFNATESELFINTSTTLEKFETTTDQQVTTTEDNEAPAESLIIKNESEEEEESDPISDAVEEVLSDDDSKEKKKPNKKKVNKTKPPKENSKEIIDDIIDGVADTIAFDDSDESPEKLNSTNVAGNSTATGSNKDKDDDDDDEDDDDDDDEEDEEENEAENDDDEDEDEDEEARKLHNQKRSHRTRQSRDMWLDRLHW